MLNIAICDDDIQTTGQIEMLIEKIAKRNFVDIDMRYSGVVKIWQMRLQQGTVMISFT